MKALTAAIFGRLSGSALSTSIGGRMYKNRAPQGSELPYIVFFVVSDTYEPTFTEDFEEVLVQFSIFSEASGTTEIEDIYANLKALYDNITMTPTGNKVIIMERRSGSLISEEADAATGTGEYYHYAVDYRILMSKD